MEEMINWKIPAFGSWEYYDEMPISHYFDPGIHAFTALNGEEDLFKVPVAMPVKYCFPHGDHCRRKARKANGVGEEKLDKRLQQQRKQGRVCNAMAATPKRRTAHPMAVDEDLYKIPPELVYTKPKKKRALRKLFSGCMGLDCVY